MATNKPVWSSCYFNDNFTEDKNTLLYFKRNDFADERQLDEIGNAKYHLITTLNCYRLDPTFSKKKKGRSTYMLTIKKTQKISRVF